MRRFRKPIKAQAFRGFDSHPLRQENMNYLTKQAKEIINKILYITIATVNEKGEPWNTPVYSAFDENYNFYWVSALINEHSQNINRTGKAFLVIYDSTVAEGTGQGVYIKADAKMLTSESEIIHATKYLYGRKNKPVRPVFDFMGDSPRRVWCAVPEQVWTNADDKVNGHHVDSRVEIKLK